MSKPFDKQELSPNNSAHCHACHCSINKNELRVGVQHWFSGYNHYHHRPPHWSPWYYHQRCCSHDQIHNLSLKHIVKKRNHDDEETPSNSSRSSSSNNNSLSLEKQLQCKKRKLVYEERGLLRERLRILRLTLANDSMRPAYYIFQDAALDSIVENMPSTLPELRECYGIGLWKASMYGRQILNVVNEYRNMIHPVVCASTSDVGNYILASPSPCDDNAGRDDDRLDKKQKAIKDDVHTPHPDRISNLNDEIKDSPPTNQDSSDNNVDD